MAEMACQTYTTTRDFIDRWTDMADCRAKATANLGLVTKYQYTTEYADRSSQRLARAIDDLRVAYNSNVIHTRKAPHMTIAHGQRDQLEQLYHSAVGVRPDIKNQGSDNYIKLPIRRVCSRACGLLPHE